MVSESVIATNKSLLSRLDQWIFKIETLFVFIGGFVILGLIFLATTNALGRWLFNLPINGYVDIIEQAMVFFAILGISYAQRLGAHVRMDILIGRLRGKTLWLVEFISTTFMFLITLALTWGSFQHFLRAFQIGDSSLDIELPTWPAKLVVPVAFSVLLIRFSIQLWGYLRVIINKNNSPIAIPQVQSPKSSAQLETNNYSNVRDF